MKVYTIESKLKGILHIFSSKKKRNAFVGYDMNSARKEHMKAFLNFEPYFDENRILKSDEWRKPLEEIGKKYRDKLPNELKEIMDDRDDELEFNEYEVR